MLLLAEMITDFWIYYLNVVWRRFSLLLGWQQQSILYVLVTCRRKYTNDSIMGSHSVLLYTD